MAQKPLDAAFGGSTEKKKKKRGGLVAIIGVVGLAGISSVFAANVNINGGSDISFSQGTAVIAACDGDGITASLGAFYNSAASAFALDTITLDGVSGDCNGKDLTVDLYDGTSKLVRLSGTITGTTVVLGTADTSLPDETTGATGIDNGASADTAAVTYEAGASATGLASNADRIVIEIN